MPHQTTLHFINARAQIMDRVYTPCLNKICATIHSFISLRNVEELLRYVQQNFASFGILCFAG